jgi:hypothetical protein
MLLELATTNQNGLPSIFGLGADSFASQVKESTLVSLAPSVNQYFVDYADPENGAGSQHGVDPENGVGRAEERRSGRPAIS